MELESCMKMFDVSGTFSKAAPVFKRELVRWLFCYSLFVF